MPLKNAETWIDDCMESIQAQSFQDWECLIINDHSSDQSLQHISVHSFFDSRFRIIENEGSGLIHAYQTGLKYSKGDLITRMDADDLMPQNRIELMVTAMIGAKPGTLITGKVSFFPESEMGIGTRFYENWLNSRMELNDHWQWIWRECVIPSPCWMVRSDELTAMGGFNDLEYPEDYDLTFKFFRAGFNVQAVTNVLHYWRQHQHRYSRTSENYSAEKFMEVKWKWFKELILPETDNLYILGTGAKAKLLANILMRQKHNFSWITHEQNVAGNIFMGKQIQWLQKIRFPDRSVVISTLSSIDNFDEAYDALPAQVRLFRFC